MIAKDIIKSYRDIKTIISIFKTALAEEKLPDVKTTNLTGMPNPTGFIPNSTENKLIDKIDDDTCINAYIEYYEALITLADNLIAGLSKPNQQIIKMLYIEGYKEWQVANQIGLSTRRVAQIKKDCFAQMQKVLDIKLVKK